MHSRRSQSIFDFAIALIAISGLIVGIVRIWIWFNANYAKRQLAYQTGRLYAAGRPRPSSYTAPIKIGANETCPDCAYQPLNLTEEWVFRGLYNETISGVPVDNTSSTSPDSICNMKCKADCAGNADCQGLDGQFDSSCDCYQACTVKCYCDSQIKTTLDIYAQQITSICGPDNNCDQSYRNCDGGQACDLRKSAKDLRDTADECDSIWDLCWWSGFGKTADELNEAASELDENAKNLEDSAKRMAKNSQRVQECCNKPTKAQQEQCMDRVKSETSCDEQCVKEVQGSMGTCSGIWQSICQAKWDSRYNSCYTLCLNSESMPCPERIANVVDNVQSEIDSLKDDKTRLEAILTEINNTLSGCAASSKSTCDAQCSASCRVCDASGIYCYIDSACYDPCYNTCYASYAPQRDLCCNQNCCQGSEQGWGRNCDTPTANCDAACGCTPGDSTCVCAKCGLSKITSDVNKEIQDRTTRINKLEQIIASLASCCDLGTVEAQNQCIENKLSQ
jgi:prefoldin subunit 5